MGYIQDIERDVRGLLDAGDTDSVVSFVKEKVLESYKNGIEEGKKPRSRKRKK